MRAFHGLGSSAVTARTSPDDDASPPPFRVQVIDRPRELDGHVRSWESLAAAGTVANVFHEPWFLRPAIEAFADARRLRLILVYHDGAVPVLTGLFPFESFDRYHGVPVRRLALWGHLHAPLGTPLVHRDHVGGTLRTLIRWARNEADGAGILDLALVDSTGRIAEAMDAARTELRLAGDVKDQHERAMLRPQGDAEAYIASTISRHHRHEYRRHRRRLAELGRFEVRELAKDEPCEPWIESYLHLENQGWKGTEGTALSSDPRAREFCLQVGRAAHARGRLQMLGLYVDDAPIALKWNFLAGTGAFAWKIAYDERFARHSPGVLLELEMIRVAHERGLEWIDSCACAQHPLVDRLWKERRQLQHCILSTGRLWAEGVVGVTAWARRLKRRLRGVSNP